DDGPGPGSARSRPPDWAISVVDPGDASRPREFLSRVDGFKTHVLTDNDSELILGLAVAAANDTDGPHPAPLVAAGMDAAVARREVLGDTAYGDSDTRVAVEAVGAGV